VIWGAIVGGFLGTVVLTTILRGASELGWTRMDLPFLLGTAAPNGFQDCIVWSEVWSENFDQS
jgi:hypothetical protein